MKDYFYRMKKYIAVTIHTDDQQLKDMLIAQLSMEGFDGFEEHADWIEAYAKETNFNQNILDALCSEHNLIYTTKLIEEKNWNEEWESNFEPVIVDDFVAVRAHFHEPVLSVTHEIIITPKMSFGTGHHATTYMMMQQMKTLPVQDKKVFDFGTGTGILAILADKLGAAHIDAIDNDEWCITNAEENISRNNCNNIHLWQSDNLDNVSKYDVVLANINKHIILRFLNSLNEMLNPNGYILLSGLLTEDEKDILAATQKLELELVCIQNRDKWISILLKKVAYASIN